MRFPRFRLRTLMIVVAIVAIVATPVTWRLREVERQRRRAELEREFARARAAISARQLSEPPAGPTQAPNQPPVLASVTGPFYSNIGPTDGPLRGMENGVTTGIYDLPECQTRVGIAYPRGVVDGRGGRPIVAFRLVLDERKAELEGLWMRDRRRFVHLGDGAELL